LDNTIEIRNLKKTFPSRRKQKKVEAVRGISLSVRKGEIFGFLGPNGAGKTTSLRMFTTLLPIDEGEVAISGFDVKKNPKEVRRHIGYVGQLGGADLEATGRENLMLSGRLYGMSKEDVKEQSEMLMDLLDIREIIDRQAKTYSGGQRRRLEIALGILHQPEVLFLDEPTTGLDLQNRANLWEHIRKLKAMGMTIFLTTHYLEEADELCDRICIVDKGVIVAEGTPRELKQEISGDVISIKPKYGVGTGTLGDPGNIFEKFEDKLNMNIEGETITLYVKDGAKSLPKIFDLLKEKQIELDTITLSQPSLNDVFLKKTGRSLRDTGKEGAE